jgi:hypothetical protein
MKGLAAVKTWATWSTGVFCIITESSATVMKSVRFQVFEKSQVMTGL